MHACFYNSYFYFIWTCPRVTLPPLSLSPRQQIFGTKLLKVTLLVILALSFGGNLILVDFIGASYLGQQSRKWINNIYPRKNVKYFSSKFICSVYHSLFILKSFFVRQVNSVFCWTNWKQEGRKWCSYIYATCSHFSQFIYTVVYLHKYLIWYRNGISKVLHNIT